MIAIKMVVQDTKLFKIVHNRSIEQIHNSMKKLNITEFEIVEIDELTLAKSIFEENIPWECYTNKEF